VSAEPADHQPCDISSLTFNDSPVRKGKPAVTQDDIRAFALEALAEMNYDTTGVDGDTLLGPAGVDLESLALAELGVRVEDRFGIKFDDDELEALAAMTVDEFCGTVATRLQPAPTAG
jgi:acyl carrier protein